MKVIEKIKIKRFLDKKDNLNFRLFLAQKNMRACEFAKKAGVTQSYLTMLLKAKRPITQKMITKFKQAGFNLNAKYDK